MKIPHSLLKDGMVVWAGKDPRKGYCCFTYSERRLWEGKRSVCFEENVEVFEKLGFEVTPHWTVQGQLRGYYAVKGLRHHGPYDDLGDIEVSPVVDIILKDGITNKSMKNLLSMEDE